MASYQNAVVYAIRSYQTDQFYIGSTRTPMYKRLSDHRGKYKQWCNDNTRQYVSSFEILQYPDAYIELIEEYPCDNVQQLRKKEGECIRLHYDTCVNVNVAGRSKKEYAEEHKEKTDAYQEAYREAHKEQQSAYDKAYREDHKEKLNAKSKAYREAHRDEVLAFSKAYREANREELLAKRREQYAKAKAAKADAP